LPAVRTLAFGGCWGWAPCSVVPKLFNLRTDPFERADITSNAYYDWFIHHAYLIFAAQAIVGQLAATFKEFPPRQKAASFTIDDALAKMSEAVSGAGD
jgi:arylsulfatase